MARIKMTRSNSPVVYQCTASNCELNIKSSYEANLHPLLGVLICRQCYKNYGDGDFAGMEDGVDEMGDDNYCRWCVDGGDLYGCSNDAALDDDRCHYSFCKECIERNIPDDPILASAGTNHLWYCYACKPDRLKKLRQDAKKAMTDLKERELNKDPKRASQPPKDSSRDKSEDEQLAVSSSKKDNVKDSGKKQSQSSSINPKVVITIESPKPKDKENLDASSKKDTIKEKPKSDEQVNKKSSKEIEKEPEVQKEARKEPQKETQKEVQKETTKEVQKEKTKETEPERQLTGKKDSSPPSEIKQKESASSSISKVKPTSQPPVMAPREFIKDLKSLNTTNSSIKKRKLSDLTIQPKVATEIFTPLKVAKDGGSSTPTRPMPPITKDDLKRRFQEIRKVTEFCYQEFNSKFDRLLEMFESREGNDPKMQKLLYDEIDSFSIPMKEYSAYLKDLKSLASNPVLDTN